MLSRSLRLASSKRTCAIKRNGPLYARFYFCAALKNFVRFSDPSAEVEEHRMMAKLNDAFFDSETKLMKLKKKIAIRNIKINYPFVRVFLVSFLISGSPYTSCMLLIRLASLLQLAPTRSSKEFSLGLLQSLHKKESGDLTIRAEFGEERKEWQLRSNR